MRTVTRRATTSGALIRGAFVAAVVLLAPSSSRGEPVAVRHSEGLAHGFVILQTPEGITLADGDLIQNSSGTRVTTRLILLFKDGSRHEETTVYTQRTTFRLVSSHVVQSGPAFKTLKESTIDVGRGQVTIRYTGEDGKEVVSQEHHELPPDLANGMTMVLLKNISPTMPKTIVSMLGFTPKPQMVQLEISPARLPHLDLGRRSAGVCGGGDVALLRRPTVADRVGQSEVADRLQFVGEEGLEGCPSDQRCRARPRGPRAKEKAALGNEVAKRRMLRLANPRGAPTARVPVDAPR